MPGIIYGGDSDAVSLTMDANELLKSLQHEAFFSQVLEVVLDGVGEQAVVRDIQRNPATDRVTHLDFLRVSADRAIDVHVPLHFINEDTCKGVKIGGGSLTHNITEVVVSCLPANLPEFIVLSRMARPAAVSVFFGFVFAVAIAGGTLAHLVAG